MTQSRFIRSTILLLSLVFLPASLAAQIQVQRVEGLAYSFDTDTGWTQISEGQVLVPGIRIVNPSIAALTIGLANDLIQVSGFSDFTIESVRGSNNSTRITLNSGRILARVEPADQSSGLSTRFSIQGPRAVAGVRGTDFEFDGRELTVLKGDVALQNLLGQSHSVRQGQVSSANGFNSIDSVENTLNERSTVQ